MKHSKAHERVRDSKRERRAHRADGSGRNERSGRSRGWRDIAMPALPDPGAPWTEVRTRVLPLLKRVHRPYPPGMEPIHLVVPPGVATGFGLDLGLAWAHVTRTLVERWEIDDADLLATALDNLRDRVTEEPPQVERRSMSSSRIMRRGRERKRVQKVVVRAK